MHAFRAIAACALAAASIGLACVTSPGTTPHAAPSPNPDSGAGPGSAPGAGVRARRVRRRVDAMQASGLRTQSQRRCFSCHHHALPAIAGARAARRGLKTDRRRLRELGEFIRDRMYEDHEIFDGDEPSVGTEGLSYALWAMDELGMEADLVTELMAGILLDQQRADGSWPQLVWRPPFEAHEHTATALAIRALKRWATADQQERAERAVTRAMAWLRETDPEEYTERRVFGLLGLYWGGGRAAEQQTAAADLLQRQRADGGWGQTDEHASDAYATGSALFALLESGRLDPGAAAHRRALAYLDRTRRAAVNWWVVPTRSRPLQPFFDNGDPGGRSQFLSIAASAWATLAELPALPAHRAAPK